MPFYFIPFLFLRQVYSENRRRQLPDVNSEAAERLPLRPVNQTHHRSPSHRLSLPPQLLPRHTVDNHLAVRQCSSLTDDVTTGALIIIYQFLSTKEHFGNKQTETDRQTNDKLLCHVWRIADCSFKSGVDRVSRTYVSNLAFRVTV